MRKYTYTLSHTRVYMHAHDWVSPPFCAKPLESDVILQLNGFATNKASPDPISVS